MKIALSYLEKSADCKEFVEEQLLEMGFEIYEQTDNRTFSGSIDATHYVTDQIKAGNVDRGVVIDDYGVIPFMVANKVKAIMCSTISDERSAEMTSRHNGAHMIALGTKISTPEMMVACIREFLTHEFDKGRHVIRYEMMEKMI